MRKLKFDGPHDDGGGEVWRNVTYQVVKREMRTWDGRPLVHLAVSRHDRRCARDWRHLQAIKNQLVGPECEAVELFPADSRMVDTCNVTHLWCIDDPEFCFPFGYVDREVEDKRPDQRPFPSSGRR